MSATPNIRQLGILRNIDLGAETDIIPKTMFKQLQPDPTPFKPPMYKIFAYGGTEIQNLGSYKVFVQPPNDHAPRPMTAQFVNAEGPLSLAMQQHKI